MQTRHPLLHLLQRMPFTTVMVLGILVVSAAAGLLGRAISSAQLSRWGFGLPDLLDGAFWRLFFAPFLILRPYMALTITTILLFFVGTCELVLHTRRAWIAFWTAHVVGYVGAFSLLDLLGHMGWSAAQALAAGRDVGASNGAFGAAGAVIPFLPAALRRLAFTGVVGFLASSLVLGHRVWDVQHALAFSCGLAIGLIFLRRDGRRLGGLWMRPSLARRQRPLAIGWMVAGMGVVNIVAAFLLPTHPGLLRLEDWLPLGSPHAPRHLLVASGLALLVLSRGLRRGHRIAWWGSILALLASFLLQLDLGVTKLEALFAMAFLLLLVAWREDLHAQPDPPSARTGMRWARNLILGVPAAGVLGVLALHTQFVRLPGTVELSTDVLRRLLFLPPLVLEPVGRRADWLLEAIPVVLWGGMLAALLQMLRAARAPRPARTEHLRVRDLVLRYGRTGTAYMASWEGNSYFFGSGGASVIAYRVHAQIAVALGDPIGPSASWSPTVAEFVAYCERQGWSCAFLGATEMLRPTYEGLGLSLLQIGEEAVLPLEGLEFRGRRWQNMRTALNRAEREGLKFTLYSGGTIPPEIEEQLFALSAQWQRGRKLPPMEFTLGRTEDVRDFEVDVGVAVDADGVVQGFVDWLPVPAERGWVIDLMRRREGAMSGLMEFLIGMSLLDFRQRGERFASLAAAPLADLDREEDDRLLPQVLGVIYENFGTFYDFKSLFAFKDSFRPRWEPLYLAFRDPAELPTVAVAILRAHLPLLEPTELVRLLGAGVASRLPLRRGSTSAPARESKSEQSDLPPSGNGGPDEC